MSSKLALKGSSKVVTDYFEYAIHNILFQRGVYPVEDFQTVRKYDLPLLMNVDDDVKLYIANIITQLKKWVYGRRILKLALVIIRKSDFEVIERWEFDINLKSNEDDSGVSREDTQREIKTIMRQITSLVSYLPVLKEDDYTFNIMVYTDPKHSASQTIPVEWCDSEDKVLTGDNVEKVKFTTFSTNIHQIGTYVSYKVDA